MQAVILVGGEGTRLRPLTSGTPKPIVTFVDRPFMGFMLEWLAGHGVEDVIMSCGFLATKVKAVLGDGSAFGVRLRFVEEPEPRGTAGALKYAGELLDERFTTKLAAQAGGFHYRLSEGQWTDTKDGSELFRELSRHASEQAGQALVFNAH